MNTNPYKKFSENIQTLKDRISKREALETVIDYPYTGRDFKKMWEKIDLTESEYWN